jgi:hypothetical protein
VSATNRGKVREPNDSYPTPPWLIRAIFPAIKDRSPQGPLAILEPACGDGEIVRELKKEFPAAQIADFDIRHGVDFLTEPPIPKYDLVITNPPYLRAREFIDCARLWLRRPITGPGSHDRDAPARQFPGLAQARQMATQRHAVNLRLATAPELRNEQERPARHGRDGICVVHMAGRRRANERDLADRGLASRNQSHRRRKQ